MGTDPNTAAGLSFLQHRDRWGNSGALWVVVAVVFSLPIIGMSLRGLRTDNDVNQWLPSDDPQMQILEWFGHEFGHEDYVLASWDGCTLADERIAQFAALLSPPTEADQPQHAVGETGIVGVVTPQDLLDEMRRNGIRADGAGRTAWRLDLAGCRESCRGQHPDRCVAHHSATDPGAHSRRG